MTSAFFGLGIGASALRTAQAQVDVTNQNIANANTPGYSRQTATIQASTPFPTPTMSSSGIPGQMGTGVQVASITRARNTFTDYQMRGQLSLQGEADARTAALAQVEATINEPSTTGLGATVTKYWAAWQEVANTPADAAVRTNLIEAGTAVADVFQSTVTEFKQQQQDLDKQVSLGVTSVNSDATQIAALNTQISQIESTGMHANDLRDQRDLVVDALSKLVKITTSEGTDGQVSINVGNHQLVDRGSVHAMQANPASTASGFAQVQWSAGSPAVTTGSAALPSTPGLTSGGTLVINGKAVTFSLNDSPAQVVNDINSTPGLGSGGSVTASLKAGALVLTSNTPGSGASVVVGTATGSAITDLGLTAGTTAGVDDNVNLGSGKLQGLVDSRDTLLQERIDDVNTLANRIIVSVNAVHESGVGLDGSSGQAFFSGTNASDMAVDSALTATNGTDKIAAARIVADPTSSTGYSSAGAGDSSNAVALAELANAVAQRSISTTAGTGLTVGNSIGATSGAKLLAVDVSGAAAGTTYTFGLHGSPAVLSLSDGTNFTAATITLGHDGATPANPIMMVDAGALRLTLSYATGLATPEIAATTDLLAAGVAATTQGGPATMGDLYAQQVAALGVESQTAQSQSANQLVLVNSLDTERQQVSGVSLDEETVNLMMYQKAYQAAARVITTMDGMLDTLINHTGTGT